MMDYGPAPLDEPDAYPGAWPSGAVVVDGPVVQTLVGVLGGVLAGRTPRLAYGADACPAQLALDGPPGAVVLTPTALRNHLVVYAGRATGYGAIPATIARWPGSLTRVFLAWLTPEQRAWADAVAGDQDRVMVPTADGLVAAHRPRTGFTLGPRRLPVRVAGITCDGQALPPAMTQVDVRLMRRAAAG